ncbi:biotin/lipoyl-containing protein [Thermodesulfobium sp. 4217-1]|uniref:biotin/lipoyl-containing protein n=1 Tax=Thermodesulfobium sp. 4217-1 TaxID=3120013 RepID=UPI003221E3E4
MSEYIFVKPGMSPSEIVGKVRNLDGVCLTSTGMRDAGQSDFKNRHRIYDLKTLAPHYNQMGLFSSECHGGARWHVGVMNRKESPFEEVEIFRELMPNVLLQTLVRETNLWGYRPYPKNVIEYVVSKVDIDVWRCFSFLNDIRNMRTVAEVVMNRGKLFEPAISFTEVEWATNEYYLKTVDEIVSLCSGTNEIILCIKDMAGVGSPKRIYSLVDCIKQKYPELVIHYHRHTTDGLALPAYLAAAQAGTKIIDVEEDSLVRFYGQPPIMSTYAYLKESGINVHLNTKAVYESIQVVREWIKHYEWAESPFKGFDYFVTKHKMPGGAFPSSFEQAQKGGFLHLMPHILHLMSLYNRIVKYFDVTPGSQITWVTCSGIINRYSKEKGEAGVTHIIRLLEKFVEEKKCSFNMMTDDEKTELLDLFKGAPGDFKNLLLGLYGRLPVGWPDDWVYQSTFAEEWEDKLKSRVDISPLDLVEEDDLEKSREELKEKISRFPSEEEFILYLMHPKDAIDMINFREDYGDTPMVLPTNVFINGLKNPGDKVEFTFSEKPYTLELVSIGKEHDGVIHVVMEVNNKTRVYKVETPRAKKKEIRFAKGSNELGSPINGNLWRLGNPKRDPIKTGDIYHKGEEIANLEAMKMETPLLAPYNCMIKEICANLNEGVVENQLLFVLKQL